MGVLWAIRRGHIQGVMGDIQAIYCLGRGHRWGIQGGIQGTYRRHIENTNNARSSRLREIQICIGYGQPTVQGIHINCKYMFVWDISCQPLGEECKLGSFFATIGRVVVKCTFLKKYLLDIHSQQFGTILTVKDICCHWIYVWVPDQSIILMRKSDLQIET